MQQWRVARWWRESREPDVTESLLSSVVRYGNVKLVIIRQLKTRDTCPWPQARAKLCGTDAAVAAYLGYTARTRTCTAESTRAFLELPLSCALCYFYSSIDLSQFCCAELHMPIARS